MTRRARLGVAAVALAALLAVYPALDQRVPVAPLAWLAVPAGVLYLAAVLRVWPDGMPLAVALLAVEYVAAVYLRGGGLDLLAPAYAVALFVCAELGWLTLESGAGHDPWAARGIAVALLACVGFLAGLGLLAVALLPFAAGPPLTAAGVLAAVAAAAALAWLARSSRGGERQF
jgi:Na+/H+ antiporter NhaD/arsenite permease-like protein